MRTVPFLTTALLTVAIAVCPRAATPIEITSGTLVLVPDVEPIPEPTTLILVGSGLVALVRGHRSRRRRPL